MQSEAFYLQGGSAAYTQRSKTLTVNKGSLGLLSFSTAVRLVPVASSVSARIEDVPAVLDQRANFAPANSAIALSVVCAAFKPSRKSLSLNVE